MEYEGFLIVSYFITAGLCAAIGWSAYVHLRRPMRAVLSRLAPARMRSLLSRSFPLSTILLALAAFASVSYRGCNGLSYHAIVTDRAYMIERNQQQLHDALFYVALTVCFWVSVMSIIVIAIRLRSSEAKRGDTGCNAE